MTSDSSHRSDDGVVVSATTMDGMLATLQREEFAAQEATRSFDGWRRALLGGSGFRHDYDADVASGGWEFYLLSHGLSLAIVDFVACRSFPRRHSYGNHLVLSAVLEGDTHLITQSGAEGELAHGYCTVYGMETGAQFQTVYEPGSPIKWVSVFINRDTFFATTGLSLQDVPERLREFLLTGLALPHRNIPLSRAASLAATQILECPFDGGFRRAFLSAKALELACHILYAIPRGSAAELAQMCFSDEDFRKLQKAKLLIETNLEAPLNVVELAGAVGLTRQKLQLGFRLAYGDTVGRIRDKVRMEHALNLVCESSLPLIEVALDSGYEHAASFTRAFKAAYGMSPVRMRRMAQQTALIRRVGARR